MFKIKDLLIENKTDYIVTDEIHPHFSFSLISNRNEEELKSYLYEIYCDDKLIYKSTEIFDRNQIMIEISNVSFLSDTCYRLKLFVASNFLNKDTKEIYFNTGKLSTKWKGKWIGKYVKIPKKSSPNPLLFRKKINIKKNVKRSIIHLTAIGIFQLFINKERKSDSYFAPGFTDYRKQLQYQTYNNLDFNKGENEIEVIVAPGWAVGAFTYKRKNKIYSNTQKLLFELIIEYEDGEKEFIVSDETWDVSKDHHLKFADFYDGEVFDARIQNYSFEKVTCYKNLSKKVKIVAEYGEKVKIIKKFEPILVNEEEDELTYDFTQNFSGVVSFEILQAEEGQKIEVLHAEILKDKKVYTRPLRTAKARILYICKKGKQEYSPLFTYMGFRYISIKGIKKENIIVKGLALSSGLKRVGILKTSNEEVNKLIESIYWGGRSNFVDIPTDCPQRDERMGWTGDIAIFSNTATFNFDMSRFFSKWLRDMNYEQSFGGGIRWTIPYDKAGLPNFAIATWGDAAILVPWATYLTRGDINLLKRQYYHMKKFVNAEKFWANFLSFSKTNKYILKYPFQFGDWCAPNEDFKEWIFKGPWISTCYFANSCNILSKVATILNKQDDALFYNNLYKKISNAFKEKFLDNEGKLKFEFQSGYALALTYLDLDESIKKVMARRLKVLIENNNYHLTTGFSGTPVLLFAVHDYIGYETAKKLLLQDTLPSWLYEIKNGATTLWERWDAIKEDGSINLGTKNEDDEGGMVSFNHYSYGSIGDYLYKRIGGLSPLSGGYKTFLVDLRKRLFESSEITYDSPYGRICVTYKNNKGNIVISIEVPVSSKATLILPNNITKFLNSGKYKFYIREK